MDIFLPMDEKDTGTRTRDKRATPDFSTTSLPSVCGQLRLHIDHDLSKMPPLS